jgi:hypothetical protein
LKGIPERASAADAPIIAGTSASTSLLEETTGRDDLYFVIKAVREEWANRTIDQPAGQNFLFGRPAFAPEKAAGNLARGISPLLVIDRERQKILARRSVLRADHRDQHDGVFHAYEHGAGCLARDLARFEGQLVAAPRECFLDMFQKDVPCSNKKDRGWRSRVNAVPACDTRTAGRRGRWRTSLLAQAQTVDQLTVLVSIGTLEVIEELAPAAHHPQKTAPRMVILDMGLEVLGQVRDARGEQGDLDFRRAGIAVRALVVFDHLGFLRVRY